MSKNVYSTLMQQHKALATFAEIVTDLSHNLFWCDHNAGNHAFLLDFDIIFGELLKVKSINTGAPASVDDLLQLPSMGPTQFTKLLSRHSVVSVPPGAEAEVIRYKRELVGNLNKDAQSLLHTLDL